MLLKNQNKFSGYPKTPGIAILLSTSCSSISCLTIFKNPKYQQGAAEEGEVGAAKGKGLNPKIKNLKLRKGVAVKGGQGWRSHPQLGRGANP